MIYIKSYKNTIVAASPKIVTQKAVAEKPFIAHRTNVD